MNSLVQTLSISARRSILDAIEHIEAGALQIAFVVDDGGCLVGVVTNGDVRRHLLQGGQTDAPVTTCMNRQFRAVAVGTSREELLKLFDLGYIAIVEDGKLVGFNVTVGGGLGMSHNQIETYPRLADVMAFCTVDQAVAVAEAVVKVQRDFGDRTDRKHARLKYTIDDQGLDLIVGQIEARSGYTLQPARAWHFDHNGDRYGWVEGEDGRWHLTLHFFAGRIADTAP